MAQDRRTSELWKWNAYVGVETVETFRGQGITPEETIGYINVLAWLRKVEQGSEKPAGFYHNIPRGKLMELLGRDYCRKIRWLEKNDYILVNHSYKKGAYSKSYALREKSYSKGKRIHVGSYLRGINPPELLPVPIVRAHGKSTNTVTGQFSDILAQHTIYIDRRQYETLLPTLPDEKVEKVNLLLAGKLNFDPFVCSTGRIYHFEIMMPSEVRPCLRFKNNVTGEVKTLPVTVDLKCAHAHFLLPALKSYNATHAVVPDAALERELKRWQRIVEHRNTWDMLKEKTGYSDKDQLKRHFATSINYGPKSFTTFTNHNQFCRWLSEAFPVMAKAIYHYNATQPVTMGTHLQSIEADIVFNSSVMEYMKAEELEMLPEHDGAVFFSNSTTEQMLGVLRLTGRYALATYGINLSFRVSVKGGEMLLRYMRCGELKPVSDLVKQRHQVLDFTWQTKAATLLEVIHGTVNAKWNSKLVELRNSFQRTPIATERTPEASDRDFKSVLGNQINNK